MVGSLLQRDGAGGLVELGARRNFADRAKHIGGGAGSQHVASGLGHAVKNFSHLLHGLARCKEHFGHAGAQRAVMIELGKTKVFERQIAKAVQGFIHGGAALAHFVQQRLNICTIHQRPSFKRVSQLGRCAPWSSSQLLMFIFWAPPHGCI